MMEQIQVETRATDEQMSSALRTFAVEEMEIVDGSTSEEDETLDEEYLAREMDEALEAVRYLAQEHKPEFVGRICDIYSELNDEEPTTSELQALFSGIQEQFAEEAIDTLSELDDELDAETLAEEMELALVQVRKQAQLDQEDLVDYIWDTFQGLNGCEPSVNDISDIFSRIKEGLALEEEEEFLEAFEDGEISDDDSYDVDEDSEAEQYVKDELMDEYESENLVESELESESEMEGDYEVDEDGAEEYWNDVLDDEDLELWVDSVEEFDGLSTEDEEELINSALFASEWCSAIEHVQSLAQADGQRLLSSVVDSLNETEDPLVVEEALDSLKDAVLEYDEEDDAEMEEELGLEMEEALDSVRALATVHGEQLANRICDLYAEENGEEMSSLKMMAIFRDVQECFAEESESSDLDEETGDDHPEEFEAEWTSAMEHVRDIAKSHQEQLLARFSSLYEESEMNPPSTGALIEMLDVVREHFADEAMDELLDDDLTFEDKRYDDDSSYDEESDAENEQYVLDSLDFELYCRSESEADSASDEAFDEKEEAETLKEIYAEDLEADLAASSESEAEEDDQKASELESDSAWSPDKSSFDYFSDYEADHFYSSSSAESSSSVSESESSAQSEAAYNPAYDLFDYSADLEEFRSSAEQSESASESVAESEESQSEDEDYEAEQDSFDYAEDEKDDIEEAVEESAEDGA